jgi:ribonuclease H / adenosylcobalamin/alpha-ribazole phosphatase
MTDAYTSVVIEADGGSRGNPGAAAYGAVLKDATTGAVIAEAADTIGVATNNVAEYRGLIAGLELYHDHAPEADLEVRMDSKLVVEQMSGRWKIKHPDMKPLASAAHRLAPFGTTFTWIPREQNKHADRILNAALDAAAGKPVKAARTATPEQGERKPLRPHPEMGEPTTLILVRHGETAHTKDRRFSGTGGDDPGLDADGEAQVRATAEWLAPLARDIDALVSSPLRRTRESAAILGEVLGMEVAIEEGLAEAAFGAWDGLTFAEVQESHADDLDAWLGAFDVEPTGGGESLETVDNRVRRARDRLIAAYPGKTVLAVTHVTPITVLVRLALGAPMESLFKLQLAPASVTVVSWYPEGQSTLRMFNARPTEAAFLGR